jgi:hypothetical protein
MVYSRERKKDPLLKSKPGISFEIFRLPIRENPSIPVYQQEKLKKKYSLVSQEFRKEMRKIFGAIGEYDLLRKYPSVSEKHLETIKALQLVLFEQAKKKKLIRKHLKFHMKWRPDIYGVIVNDLLDEK